jgi:hypothetical protein
VTPQEIEAGRVLAQGHLHKLIKLEGGLVFMRNGSTEPLFTASYGSRACDLYPEATRQDLASLVFFLAGRVLALEEGRA